jgi:hypothetical protein
MTEPSLHPPSSEVQLRKETEIDLTSSSRLWFERIASALKMPLWIGILAVALIPTIASWVLGTEIGIATAYTGIPALSLPLLILYVIFLVEASRLIRLRVIRLRDYTRTLGADPGGRDLRRLVDLKATFALWIALLAVTTIFFDPFAYGLHYSIYQSLLRILVTGYLRFMQATFLLILGGSMYCIYKWGKLPMRLKPFTEDRSLGLSAYGSASLLFMTLYLIAVLLTFPPFVYSNTTVLPGQIIFFPLGLVIFAGPLLSLREKLAETKKEKLDWIQRRHGHVIELIESSQDGPIDPALVNELIAIDSIRKDLDRIHTWPFNASILARLAGVVGLPLVSLVLTYLLHVLSL